MKRFYTSMLFIVINCTISLAQTSGIVVSGVVQDTTKTPFPFVNVVLKTVKDSVFVTGTITDEEGRFSLDKIPPGNYLLECSYVGSSRKTQSIFVGSLSPFLDLGFIQLEEESGPLGEVVVTGKKDEVDDGMDRKTYSTESNISQSGGSVLQVMQNLPGVSVQDGKVQLRGSDKIIILIDGKQSGLTGFGSQSSLDNIPASSIERIEIINNPSSKYDANGNAGIINIIMKKSKKEGFNAKVGLMGGLGALWVRKENLPTIRPQYQDTPKINPSLSFNYRKKKINFFYQGDYLYTQTLNKNEFVTRTYDDGTVIQQQTKRNRNTHFLNSKAGVDWNVDESNAFNFYALYGMEKIIDRGDEPFFNEDLSQRLRLWQFLEDELKTTVTASALYNHRFKQPGRMVTVGLNYTFHRENEKYFFDNIYPSYTGHDSFKLLSDEHVMDFSLDYVRPLKYGRIEGGIKFRKRNIPTNMQFMPGLNSPLDTNAGGWATYRETIPAVYGNYIYENEKIEAEVGLRLEYVDLQYEVNPNHNTYKSDGYNYLQPFPTVRLAYKINDQNKLSVFYNRRVDRPNEIDIRIFPKYDDAEIIKVGNPALRPQYTNSVELGYKASLKDGYFYLAAYHRSANGTITRIASTVPGSTLIYSVFQNAQRSYNTGLEIVYSKKVSPSLSFNVNVNVFRNQIDAFTVENKYPVTHTFSADKQEIFSGNAKLNTLFHLAKKWDAQLTMIYLAPNIVPQGKTGAQFSMDAGIKKSIQNDKGEVYVNATDILNTMVIRKEIQGDGFRYTSSDYYETQVFRIGYSYKF